MSSSTTREVAHRQLIEEIALLEDLLAENGPPEDHDRRWSLHLIQVMLRLRRQRLREFATEAG